MAKVSKTKGAATLGVLRSVKCFYISGLPVTVFPKFIRVVRGSRAPVGGITLKISIQDKRSVSKLRGSLRRVSRGKVGCRVLFLSTGSSMLMGQCGRAEERRPLDKSKHISANVTGRHRGATFLGVGTACVLSADGVLAERLGVRLRGVFIGNRDFYGLCVAMVSFNFGCKVPRSTSLMFSIHFLPGPCCVSALGRGAKGSPRIRSCIVRGSGKPVFLRGLGSVIRFLVPGCVLRKGGRLIVTVKYANKGRESMALTGTLCRALRARRDCNIHVRRHSVKGSDVAGEGWGIRGVSFSKGIGRRLTEGVDSTERYRVTRLASFVNVYKAIMVGDFSQYDVGVHARGVLITEGIFALVRGAFGVEDSVSIQEGVGGRARGCSIVMGGRRSTVHVLRTAGVVKRRRRGTRRLRTIGPVVIRRIYYQETFLHKTFRTSKSVDSPGGTCRFRVIYSARRVTRRVYSLVYDFSVSTGVILEGGSCIICLGRKTRVMSVLGVVRTRISLVRLRGMEVLGRVEGSIGEGIGYRATGVGGAMSTTIGRLRSVACLESRVKFRGVPGKLIRTTLTHLRRPRTALGRLKRSLGPPIKGSNVGRELHGLDRVTSGIQRRRKKLL